MSQTVSGRPAAMPAPSQLFKNWQEAVSALNAAEAHSAPYQQVMQLAAGVIQARNAVTIDRIEAGWHAPHDVLRQLASDEWLLRQKDDAADANAAGAAAQ